MNSNKTFANFVFIIFCIIFAWALTVPIYFYPPVSADGIWPWFLVQSTFEFKYSPFLFSQTPGYAFSINSFWMNLLVGLFTYKSNIYIFGYIKLLTELAVMILCGIYFVSTACKTFFQRKAGFTEYFVAVLIPIFLMYASLGTELFFFHFNYISYSTDFFFILLFIAVLIKLLFIQNYKLTKGDYLIFALLVYASFTNLAIVLFFFLPTLAILILHFNLPKAKKLIIFFTVVIPSGLLLRKIINVHKTDGYFSINISKILVKISIYPSFLKQIVNGNIIILLLVILIHLVILYCVFILVKRLHSIFKRKFNEEITPLQFIAYVGTVSFFASLLSQSVDVYPFFSLRYFDVPIVIFCTMFLYFLVQKNYKLKLMVFVVGFLALIFITEKKFIIKFYNKDYNLYLKDLTPLLKQEGFARDPHLKGHIELNECLKENTARYNLDFGLGGFSYNRVIIFLNDFKHKEVKIHNGGGAGSVWDEPRVVFPDTSVHPWLAHPDWFSYTKARYNYIVLLNDFELSDDHFTQTLFDTKFKCNNYTVYVISKEENIERFNNSKLYAKNKMPQFELSSIFEGRGGFKIKNKILELSLNKLQTVKNKTAEGVITYGPYLRLAKGKYKISIEYEINEFGEKTKMPLEVILTKETKSVDRQLFELKFEENGTIILPKKMQSEILPVEINLETNTLNKKEVKEFIFEVNTRRIKGFQVITLLKDSSGSFTLYSIKIEKI